MDDAVGKLFADTDRKMKPYKKANLNYNISCGWLVVEVDGKDMGATEGSCLVAEMLKKLTDDARANSRLMAVMCIACYVADNRDLCLFQLWGTNDVYWCMYSDSDP